MGVVFFPSLPFMGVMLFPSSWLGNASREWGLVRPSPPTPHSLSFFPLSSPFSSFSSSAPAIYFFMYPPLSLPGHQPFYLSSLSPSSPPSCLLFIMSFSFVSLPLLFFFFFFFLNQQLSLPGHQPFSLPGHQSFSLPGHQSFSLPGHQLFSSF